MKKSCIAWSWRENGPFPLRQNEKRLESSSSSVYLFALNFSCLDSIIREDNRFVSPTLETILMI